MKIWNMVKLCYSSVGVTTVKIMVKDTKWDLKEGKQAGQLSLFISNEFQLGWNWIWADILENSSVPFEVGHQRPSASYVLIRGKNIVRRIKEVLLIINKVFIYSSTCLEL